MKAVLPGAYRFDVHPTLLGTLRKGAPQVEIALGDGKESLGVDQANPRAVLDVHGPMNSLQIRTDRSIDPHLDRGPRQGRSEQAQSKQSERSPDVPLRRRSRAHC